MPSFPDAAAAIDDRPQNPQSTYYSINVAPPGQSAEPENAAYLKKSSESAKVPKLVSRKTGLGKNDLAAT